jgi:two-component system, LuxR family, sensor kinase FixL
MRPWTLIAFVIGYLFLDWVSYVYPVQSSAITPWNPHPALAVALLMAGGQRWLFLVAAVIFGAEVVVRQMPAGLVGTLLVATVLALGYAAIAAALKNVLSTAGRIESPSELGRAILVITLGTLVTGALYVGSLWAAGVPLPGAYFESLLQFWIGDCVGILVTLPVVLILERAHGRVRAVLRDPIAWLQASAIVFALWLVFGPTFAQPFKFFYVLFLPLIWISMRFGFPGAAIGALVIQCGVIAAALVAGTAALTVFELQALLIALTITGLFLGITVDQRRRAARDLQESLRLAAAGEMSAALAHELNQPLAALGAYLKSAMLIAGRPAQDARTLLETLGKANDEAQRAAEVVRRLRDFFRTGSTKLESASLPGIVAAVVASAAPRASSLGIALTHRSEPDVPPVLVDSLQIEVVLRNLVANGLDAAAAAAGTKAVSVEVARGDPGYVKALVRDSGRGVATEDADKVFEAFWSSRSTGMGMGLAISRAIVEAHGGRMWIENGGAGAFAFTIPSADGSP